MINLTIAEKRKILEKCRNAIDNTSWYNNYSFPAGITIHQAIQLARSNKDAGPTGAKQLEPNNLDFHAWMDYVHLLTIYYNIGKTTKKFTILRTGWNHKSLHKYDEKNAITVIVHILFIYSSYLLRVTVYKLGP